ncbi:hypothetical protein PINS_up011679 [Pythium insidiosum]|nr:hypothetical protein PINS_up011679 [Pythium insidiosum]
MATEQQRTGDDSKDEGGERQQPGDPAMPTDVAAVAPSLHRASSSSDSFVLLSPWAFRLAWLGILALHGLCAFYFALSALMYDKTPGSVLEIAFVAYKVGMPMENYPVLTNVHAFFATVHVLLGALMVVWSLGRRRLAFGPQQEPELSLDALRKRRSKVVSNSSPAIQSSAQRKGCCARMRSHLKRLARWLASIFGRRGLFGVEGEHFEEILAVREIVESVLQAYQAYGMSQNLVRPWLNRFFVAMLVVNCWMAPLVHLVYRRDALLRRALSLLMDAILDFTAAMLVPAVLMLSYYDQFDPVIWGFPNALWYDDVWTVKILSELQIMLVMTWGNLASRCVFSIGLISCIESAKELIRQAPATTEKDVATSTETETPTKTAAPLKTRLSRASTGRLRLLTSFRHAQSNYLRRFLQSLQVLCALLGVIVIVLHVYAESAPRLEQCLIQVKPWLERKPACLFLEWDCHINGDAGEAAAITAQWSKSSPTYVRRIMILHCAALTMPPIFTTRHELTGLKMYNTTIAMWGADAAITETNHPQMMMAYFVRVNMSATGELPQGLMTHPFPSSLADIELAVSNLHALPDSLDSLWPPHMFFFCDYCAFSALPRVLSRLSPYWVSLAMNPFASFPFDVFQVPDLEHFQLGGLSLSLVPTVADEVLLKDTSVRYLYLPGTNLTWLPRWVDAFAELPRALWYQPALDLTATPICDAIGRLQAGTLERFPVEWTASVPADQVSRYMFVTRSNVSALDRVVACNGLPLLTYPLDEDDVRYMQRS